MPYAFSIGISYFDFMRLNPKKLKSLTKGYEMRLKQTDYLNWMLGMYIESAVLTAVEHNLAGNKAQSKYVEKPFLQEMQEKEGDLSEEEKQRQIDQFWLGLQIRKANWDLEHKNKNNKDEGKD